MASVHVTVYPQAFSWHLRQSLPGVHEAQLDDRMHANRRVLIILALEVLGQADLVGTPVEYDKVAPTMQHPNSAGAPQQYLNGQGAAPPDMWSSNCPLPPCTSAACSCIHLGTAVDCVESSMVLALSPAMLVAPIYAKIIWRTDAPHLLAAVNHGGPVRYGNAAQGGPAADPGPVPAMSGASGVYGVNPAQRGPYGGPQAAGGYGAPPQNQGNLSMPVISAKSESLFCTLSAMPQLYEA